MFQEKRPTCVTVIGGVWIVFGVLMFLSSVMGLLSWNMVGEAAKSEPNFHQNMPSIMSFFPHIVAVQSIVAIFGLISAINFLRLRSWSRAVLEIVTWILLIAIAGFSVYWEVGWVSSSFSNGPDGFDILGAVMGLFIFAMFVIPLVIMLRYLRGDKVKNATQPAAVAESR